MVTPMIPLPSCSYPQSLPLIWTASRRWCRLLCVWCRLPPVCRLAQRRPSQESSLSCPWQLCGGRPATAQPCPTFGPWSSPATRRDNQTAYILHILSTDATTLCILYIYICSQGLGRWWAGVQEALSRPAQVSVDVSSGGGPRVAQEAHTGTHWHTGTGGVLVLALSLPPASPPDSRTQQHSDPPHPSTSSTGTTRHQASSSSTPPTLV